MTTIRVTYSGESITVTANLAEASAPICIDGSATQYQTASARHRADLAVALACRLTWPGADWPHVSAAGSIPSDWPNDNCEAWDAMSYELVEESDEAAGAAIAESITTNGIAHRPWSQALADALTDASDDSAENGAVVEFWGADDEGSEWRVHLTREAASE